MNRTMTSLTILGSLLATAGSAVALPPPLPAPGASSREKAPEPSLARLEFKSTTYNVGNVFDHEEQKFAFEFTNTGSENLVISRVQSSCGCTAGDLEKTEYAPGESGKIDVTFNPKGKKGEQRRQLTVYSNDSSGRETILTVTGSVTQLVAVDPAVLSLGTVPKGQSTTKYITVTGRTPDFEVTRATPGDLEIFKVKVLGTEVVEEPAPAPIAAPGQPAPEEKPKTEQLRRTTLEVTLSENARIGRIDDRITIRTNDPRRPIVQAQVIANVMGDLSVTPPRISIGRPELGDTMTREFTVASRSGEAFEIKEIRFADGPLRIKFDAKPVDPENPNTYTVRMETTAARVHPRLRQDIVILTDVKGEEQITVPVSGVIVTRQ
jgi:hypothetical protein